MYFRSLIVAAGFATAAVAQTTSSVSAASASSTLAIASGCSLSKATATAQSDLDDYSSCSALKGDLVIAGDFASASLSNVQAIYGSLIIKNLTSLVSFTATSLTTITEELSLTELTIFDSLSLPLLTTVGSVNLVSLPALDSIQLNTGITSLNSLVISDTALENLDGFDIDSLDTFNINNNKNLNSIDSQLKYVKSALEVSYNSEDVEVAFDDLEWANNITFRDISSISLASLQKVNASLGFINNTVDSIEIPYLTTVGGSLSFISNDNLDSIDLSNLTSIAGGFEISNNSALEDIDGFDSLKTVGGAIIFVGNFSNASLPSLTRVSGGVDIDSSSELDCDSFNKLDKKGAIQGNNYVCKGLSTSVSASESSVSSSSASSAVSSGSSDSDSVSSSSAASSASASHSSSSSASSKSKGDAAAVVFQATTLFSAFAAICLSLL